MADAKRSAVLVGRLWHEPTIHVFVVADHLDAEGQFKSSGEIGIKMALPDFLHALVLEIGDPTELLSMKMVQDRLMAAAERVVEGMKEETNRVM